MALEGGEAVRPRSRRRIRRTPATSRRAEGAPVAVRSRRGVFSRDDVSIIRVSISTLILR